MKRFATTVLVGTWLVMVIASQVGADFADANEPVSNTRDGPAEPNFAAYYEPWAFEVEPNIISYELPLDLSGLRNYADVDRILNLNEAGDLISQQGFAVIERAFEDDPNREDIVRPYEYLRDQNVPMFVTADTLLYLYHVQFDETLKEVEETEFFDDIRMLTDTLLDEALRQYDLLEGDLREAARRNVAYLAVAGRLIGLTSPVPEMVSEEVAGELAKIEAHAGFEDSDIFIYTEDYSQYMPRGHYTRSAELQRYFKTLMWFGRMAFLLKGHENWGPAPENEALVSPYDARIQTLQACLLAGSFDTQTVDDRSARDVWGRIYTVTAFYVGVADDLTPYDYLWALDRVLSGDYAITDLEDPNQLHEVKTELALLPSPQIFGGTGNIRVASPFTAETLNEGLNKTLGMRLMGQRFVPDSYMFQNLVLPQVGDYTGPRENLPFTSVVTDIGIIRGYPRGLDVMALLGSEEARDILISEWDAAYEGYWDRFDELAGQFGAFGPEDWNRNLYWGWLYSLKALLGGYGEGYPAFMRTEAWSRRCLHAALASWTELRHDTILYAKQSYSFYPDSAFGGPPTPTCYVEPAPEFFARLLALTRMTRSGLSDLQVLSEGARERMTSLEEILSRLIEIAAKQLTNQPLSGDDRFFLDHMAENLEILIVGIYDAYPNVAGLKATLVADVHTCGVEGMVLEEAVGKVDLMVVACPLVDGSAFLAVGPVLSYYEFKHPMADRLTDEAWRELLDSPDKPDRPAWYQPLMR